MWSAFRGKELQVHGARSSLAGTYVGYEQVLKVSSPAPCHLQKPPCKAVDKICISSDAWPTPRLKREIISKQIECVNSSLFRIKVVGIWTPLWVDVFW